jgi:hypothetical protein
VFGSSSSNDLSNLSGPSVEDVAVKNEVENRTTSEIALSGEKPETELTPIVI